MQQYILIKPNNYCFNGQFQALQSVENVPLQNELMSISSVVASKNKNNQCSYVVDKVLQRSNTTTKRNARERRRVKLINLGYETLRRHVPAGVENKKLSKVETLRSAVDYIKYLQKLLTKTEAQNLNIKQETPDNMSSNLSNQWSLQNSNISQENINLHPASRPRTTLDKREENAVTDIEEWLLNSTENYGEKFNLKGK
ncbi:hypothetical protein KUTeg_006986 [Tegillarca granosa]|uniref:BHLH domain-containing protein n=1 Tax=Tegillarca granosa TaxID=220873 RepID=A0ABQ9FDX1_TEGGR|nr:hypothetical protein KUTeg_006986 [Tegillarca granosa]